VNVLQRHNQFIFGHGFQMVVDCLDYFVIQFIFLLTLHRFVYDYLLDFFALPWYTGGGRGKAPGSPYGVR
jgi:hypothetical protein